MKRNISNMSMFQGCDFLKSCSVVDPDYVITDSEMDRIFKEIFSVDEKSGLPKGDLAYFLSPDGNPQVKAWLENNLLKPRAVSTGTTLEGVTDDMLAEFARGSNESPEDYATRLKGIYDKSVADIEKFKVEQLKSDVNE